MRSLGDASMSEIGLNSLQDPSFVSGSQTQNVVAYADDTRTQHPWAT